MKYLAASCILILAIVALSRAQDCDDVMCQRQCENGFKVDANGCEICDCKECADVKCRMYCEYGFKQDANGCDICECNPATEIRAGQCPQVDEDMEGTCDELCAHDGVCPGTQKCCSDGCGHACVDVAVVKYSYCPAADSFGSFGTCANTCEKDSTCSGAQKCCRNACGATVCVEPASEKRGTCPIGQLVEGTFGLCADLCTLDDDCPALQKCCSNGCGRVCVTPTDLLEVHSGSCPAVGAGVGICASVCDNDGGCGDTEKCCSGACDGYSCVVAIDVPVKCDDVMCLRWCAYGNKVDTNGCNICDCVEPTEIHAGVCPVEPSGGDVGICVENCDHDGDCNDDQKCCTNGCGHACVAVAPSEPEGCPINAYPEGELGICADTCPMDGCPPGELCCSNGCGHACKQSVTVHSGTCPTGDLEKGWSGVCGEMCNDDGKCATNQKCCSNGCGHVCITVEESAENCDDVVCQIFCEYGNKKDSNDCIICECQTPKDAEVERAGECPVGFLPEGIVGTCVEDCSVDANCTDKSQKCCSNGCGHICVDALNVESECPPVLCTRYCENGLQKDDKGCEICACNEEKTCDDVMCLRHCSYGYTEDKNGCPICDCKEKPSKCEASICSDFCIYGFERDSEGCEICQCTSELSANFVQEGTCPVVSGDNEAGSCPDLCDNDSECNAGDKCCFNECGRVCTASGAYILASSLILVVGTLLCTIATWKL